MADKYIRNNAGQLTETEALVSSLGPADAGRIPALDASGRFDQSMMPAGIGADTAAIQASEALSAGDFVNVWDSGGARVRKADCSAAGKEAHGFVIAAAASGAMATVYFEGPNTALSGATPGVAYLGVAGAAAASAPSGAGAVVQRIGVAVGPTAINFESGVPVVLA